MAMENGPGLSRCISVFPSEHGDIPASYFSLLEVMTFLFLFQGVIFEIRSVMLWVCGTGVFNMWTTGVFPGPLRLAS